MSFERYDIRANEASIGESFTTLTACEKRVMELLGDYGYLEIYDIDDELVDGYDADEEGL